MKEQTGETTGIKPYSGLRPTGPISEVFNEDNMIGMARYPDKFFDLAVVDPPYGIGSWWKKSKHTAHYDNKKWNESRPDVEYFNELFRISKNQIIWGGNYFADFLPVTNSWIIWDKIMNDNPNRIVNWHGRRSSKK